MGAAAHAQVERRCAAAELAGIEQPAGEAEFESVAEPFVAEMGKAQVLVGYTGRLADDHTHPARQCHILLGCVAAAAAVD